MVLLKSPVLFRFYVGSSIPSSGGVNTWRIFSFFLVKHLFSHNKPEHVGELSSEANRLFPPQLVNINENYMSLMSDNGDIREDLRVPENEVGKEIEAKFDAGEEFMVSGDPHLEMSDHLKSPAVPSSDGWDEGGTCQVSDD